MDDDEKVEVVQLLHIAGDYLTLLRGVLELTSGSNTDKWRIDDWQGRSRKVINHISSKPRKRWRKL